MILTHCYIIPNFNGALFIGGTIQKCLTESDHKIIVVDDFSNDLSIDVISQYPVTLIKRDKNGGFAAAVNSGLAEAMKQGIKFVSIMNSDVLIPDKFDIKINDVVKLLEADPKIAIAGYKESGTDRLFVGDKISGFFFTLRVSVLSQTGFLNEDFFMYGEETDFFRRVLKHEYSIYQTGIELSHGSEKSSLSRIENSRYSIRNSIYLELVHRRWLGSIKVVAVLFLIINKLYHPLGWQNDPSINRIRRPGFFLGNYFLVCGILWSTKKILGSKNGNR